MLFKDLVNRSMAIRIQNYNDCYQLFILILLHIVNIYFRFFVLILLSNASETNKHQLFILEPFHIQLTINMILYNKIIQVGLGRR